MNEYKIDDKIVTYSVVDNGYELYLDGKLWITQYEPNIPFRNKTYEENAILQIEDLISASKYMPTSEDDINLMLIDHEYRLTITELGV